MGVYVHMSIHIRGDHISMTYLHRCMYFGLSHYRPVLLSYVYNGCSVLSSGRQC